MTDPLLPSGADTGPTASPVSYFVDSPRARRLAQVQFVFCLIITTGVLCCLLWPGGERNSSASQAPAAMEDSARLTESGDIRIRGDCPLHEKLETLTVRSQTIAAPVLTVTGTVVAGLRRTRGGERDWQFNSPELLTTYTDWQKAQADIVFAKTQLDSINKLADSRVAAQAARAERLKKLVDAGTETESDLAAAQAELLQAQIEGHKELHEAEAASLLARRSEAALRRQLEQAGVDPALLRVTAEPVDVVVADVPEALAARVRVGQRCEARFYGVGAKPFEGTLRSIAPVLSSERRSLRVLFTVGDPDDLLRPGMFADIGLGTDSREALLIPLAAVIHVGRSDYLLVRTDAGDWRASAVQVGEVHEGSVEILDGLKAGDEVIGKGAILLKPLVVAAVERPNVQKTGGP